MIPCTAQSAANILNWPPMGQTGCPRARDCGCTCTATCASLCVSNPSITFQGGDTAINEFGRQLIQLEKDAKRAALRRENKQQHEEWVGTKLGRPFHLRRWYK